jgi:hypothetical protein
MGKKKESAFMRDIINIIKEGNVVTTLSEEERSISCSGDILEGGLFRKGDYLYLIKGEIFVMWGGYRLDYTVIRSKINDNVTDIICKRHPVIFNDFMIETADLMVEDDGYIRPRFCETRKYKQNACNLCSDTKTFCCYKSHSKSNKHKNNVIKRNKMYADTIGDATKLNIDVCMLITSYLF